MGRYDLSLKCVEIRRLLDSRNYKKALSILETIDTDKVKNITDLNAFADVYRKMEQYDLAEEILLRVYEKSPTYRVIYKLVIISIKKGNLKGAEAYYKDYVEIAPETTEKYILRYRIDKSKQSDYESRIESLEKLKKIDYIEEWAYELAKLYHKAGMAEKCIAECDDIILWFSEGVIVEKAKMLRSYYMDGADFINNHSKVKNISSINKRVGIHTEKLFETRDLKQDLGHISVQEVDEPTLDLHAAIQEEMEKTKPIHINQEIYQEMETFQGKEFNETTNLEKDLESYDETDSQEEYILERLGNISVQQPFGDTVPMEYEEETYDGDQGYSYSEERVQADYLAEQIQEYREDDSQNGYEFQEGQNESDATGYQAMEEDPDSYAYQSIDSEKVLKNSGVEQTEYNQGDYVKNNRIESSDEIISSAAEEINYETEEKPIFFLIEETDVTSFFEEYFNNESLCRQMKEAFEKLTQTKEQPHFLLNVKEGDEMEATNFAKCLAKALQKANYIKTSRLAKISAVKLNRMKLETKADKLVDGTLLIEEAHEMYVPTVRSLAKIMDELNQGIVVMLVSTEDKKEIMLEENYELRERFFYDIHIS